ncbi:hypothetical protein HaloA020_29640 [Halomonas sp. A020]|nr:hypothetical protein HaloA020_29640 [Halomonas sp. A020]
MIRVLAYVASIAILTMSFWLGREVPFSEQWPLFEALRTTAAIIFAVVGAWLAIIYPDRLKISFSQLKGGKKTAQNGSGIGKLFTPVAHSTAILCVILLLGILAPLIKTIDVLHDHVELLRGCSYLVLSSLTLWQLWTVILSLVPADVIVTQSNNDERRQKTLNGLTSQARFEKRPPERDERKGKDDESGN